MIDETVAEIRAMRTHSTSAVAVKATRSLADLLDREYVTVDEFERDLEHNAGVLRRSNPSHAALHNAMREVERSIVGEATSVEDGKQRLEDTIDRVVDDIETAKGEAAANATERIEDGDTLLVHDYSTTVLEAIENAARDGAHLTVYVTEARPRTLGRKTARVLAGIARVDTRMVVDSAMGYALRDCDQVLLGITCMTGGTYYNRIGTFPLVVTARELGVPVTAVGSDAKRIEEFRFENEFRDAVEVMREPVEDVTIENPSYDATPIGMLDTIITDDGIVE
ncbi:translation initiation factor eIF-2B [Halorubrum lacusprofundi]|jgi:translation initiation factor eIF-2B subunit delta|nr:translation initiation factor eIF-2B [Halorubrum lacusprofundi]MCG1006992.1 translation initiation factor eIF-2B [Halorubrum lacusprofundi]